MYVMRPIVLGLIASAVIALIPTALFVQGAIDASWFQKIDVYAVIIAIGAVLAVMKFKISPILVVLGSGVLGIIFYQII